MPRPKTSDPAPALTAAYARLAQSGRPPTVRALRAEAGVSTEAAGKWLAANRPNPQAPGPPLDELRPALDTLWATAWSTARDECKSQHADMLQAHAASEAHALEHNGQLTTQLETCRRQLAELEGELGRTHDHLERVRAAAKSDQRELMARAEQAERAEATERERARTAEKAAATAEATESTLRRLLEQHFLAKTTQ